MPMELANNQDVKQDLHSTDSIILACLAQPLSIAQLVPLVIHHKQFLQHYSMEISNQDCHQFK